MQVRIWQIHPFAEGNTRTTAVFTMKYLQTFGFKPGNTIEVALPTGGGIMTDESTRESPAIKSFME